MSVSPRVKSSKVDGGEARTGSTGSRSLHCRFFQVSDNSSPLVNKWAALGAQVEVKECEIDDEEYTVRNLSSRTS